MKITFPECQFEISIEEYLILLDRETKGYTMTMQFPLPGEKAQVCAHVQPPVPYPSQEEPEQIPEPPKFKMPKTVKPKEKKKPAKRGPRMKKKVDVLRKDGWKTFDSAEEAAEFLGMSVTALRNDIQRGHKAKGHEVRYHDEALDEILAEIEANNRKPYEVSPKP